MPRAKQRTPELRDRVLAAALTLLASEGVAALTTRAVARAAGTSVPAVYELFGDKAGLIRELFFTGFRRLHQRLLEQRATVDPRADLVRMATTFRAFTQDEPGLAQLMFSRPFAEFELSPADARAGAAVRSRVVERVSAAVDSQAVVGGPVDPVDTVDTVDPVDPVDPVDMAHVLLATVQGLALQESGGWLGSTPEARERRWALAVDAVVSGLSPRGARVS